MVGAAKRKKDKIRHLGARVRNGAEEGKAQGRAGEGSWVRLEKV